MSRLQNYLLPNELLEPFQSGFRARHSTETALVREANDLFMTADTGALNILLLLERSAAFVAVNLNILIERMDKLNGSTDSVLCWLSPICLIDNILQHLKTLNQIFLLSFRVSHRALS